MASISSVSDIMTDWQARLFGDRKISAVLSSPFSITLEGDGGGTWLLSAKTSDPKPPPSPALQVHLSVDDFKAILSGTLNAQQAYAQARIRLSGRAELALPLCLLFDLRSRYEA